MILAGYSHKVVGDLGPTQIIDPQYVVGDPALLAAHCLAAVDPLIAERVRDGDILVVDGELRGDAGAEMALVALQALGIAAVICRAAAPEMLEFAAVYGLALLVAPAAAAEIKSGALMRLDLGRGAIEADGQPWTAPRSDGATIAAVRRAQLLARMRRVVEDEGYAE